MQRKHLRHSSQIDTNNKNPRENRENIADILQKQKLIRQAKAIQISLNIKFTPTHFNTSQTMDTFCTDRLTLLDTFQVTFTPGFQKRKPRQIEFTYISFLNVPSEAEESALTLCRGVCYSFKSPKISS